MKITIVSPAYPYRGGIANFTSMLYRELKKEHDVNVINFSRQYPSLIFPGKTQIEDGDTTNEIATRRIIDTINPLTWFKAGDIIKREKPDWVIFAYWLPFFAPVFGKIASKLKENGTTKTLALCHNILPHEKRMFDVSLTKYFFKKMDSYILLSNAVKEDLLSINKNARYKTLFHPLYSNFGEPVSKTEAREKLKLDKKNILLFFGFIREYKGVDVLLEAMTILKRDLDCKLLVVGEFYSDENKLRQLVKSFGIEENVLFVSEFVPSEDVKYYFSASDVVVLPYRSATQSGVTLVAKNFNKPVIATNVGGLSEIVEEGKNGYLVEPENPELLAETILKYFKLNKEEEFTQAIMEETEKYSWKRFSEELIKFINND